MTRTPLFNQSCKESEYNGKATKAETILILFSEENETAKGNRRGVSSDTRRKLRENFAHKRQFLSQRKATVVFIEGFSKTAFILWKFWRVNIMFKLIIIIIMKEKTFAVLIKISAGDSNRGELPNPFLKSRTSSVLLSQVLIFPVGHP